MEEYIEKQRKKKRKMAFTLVELLAVIVILAIILVIAVPKIMDTIAKSKKAAIESSAKIAASAVEKAYQISLAKGEEGTLPRTGSCMDIAGLDGDEYKNCTYVIGSNEKATVNMSGTDKGKFANYVCCNATKTSATCDTAVSDISKCPGVLVEEEKEPTPEACFNYEDVTGGVSITGYKIGTLVSYDIDEAKCLDYLIEKKGLLTNENVGTLCKGGSTNNGTNDKTFEEFLEYSKTAKGNLYFNLILNGVIYNLVYSGCNADVVIPDQLGGKDVVEIAADAFTKDGVLTYNEKDIVPSFTATQNVGIPINSVVLPKKLVSIGDYAFAGNFLTTLVIPDSVTTIGDGAFMTNRITSLTIGKSLTTMGISAFEVNPNLVQAGVIDNHINYLTFLGACFDNNIVINNSGVIQD